MKVVISILLFSLSLWAQTDLDRFRALHPFAHGIKKVQFEQECTRGTGRARQGAGCRNIPVIVDDIEPLQKLVRNYEVGSDTEADVYYNEALTFLRIYQDFNTRCDVGDEAHVFDGLINNYECASKIESSEYFNDYNEIVSVVNNENITRLTQLQNAVQSSAIVDSFKSYLYFADRALSEDENLNLDPYRISMKIQNFCITEVGQVCSPEVRSKLLNMAQKMNGQRNLLDKKTDIRNRFDELNTRLNEIIERGNQELAILNAKPNSRAQGGNRKQRDINSKRAQIRAEFENVLNEYKLETGNELLLTDVMHDHFQLNIEEGTFKSLNEIDPADFIVALSQGQEKIKGQLQELLTRQQKYTNELNERSEGTFTKDFERNRLEDLKFLFRTNPAAAASALRSNPRRTQPFCQVISEMVADQNREQLLDRAFLVVGVGIAGVGLLTGIGTGPSAAALAGLLAASAALTATEATYHFSRASSLRLDSEMQLANILALNGDDQSVEQLNQTLEQYRSSDMNGKLVLGLGSLDFIGAGTLGRAARLSRAERLATRNRVRGLEQIRSHPQFNNIFADIRSSSGQLRADSLLAELSTSDKPLELLEQIRILQQRPQGFKLDDLFDRDLAANDKLHQVVNRANRVALEQEHPNFSRALNAIRARSARGFLTSGKDYRSIRDVDFFQSDGFRPQTLRGEDGHQKIVQRFNELDPSMQNAMLRAFNDLDNNQVVNDYFEELYTEAFTWQLQHNRAGRFTAKIEAGNLDEHALNVTLVKRAKARGDNQFTNLQTGELITGRLPSPAPEASRNDLFRQAAGSGPFMDFAFESVNGSTVSGHGVFSHVLQRDLVRRGLQEELGERYHEFYQFLGSPRGVTFWGDLFDSGAGNSMTRPEVVTARIRSLLIETPENNLSP